MTRWILLATVCLALGACADSSQKAPVAKAAAEAEHDHAADDGHDHGKSDEGGGDEHDHEHEEGEPDFAKIDPARSAELGIVVATAASGNVDEVLTLTGRLIIDPRRVAAVRARFPGPVVAVLNAPTRTSNVSPRVTTSATRRRRRKRSNHRTPAKQRTSSSVSRA